MKRLLLLAGGLFLSLLCSAQRFSVSTNVVDYADFLTLNVEGDLAVARRWTLVAGAKYNPYLFRSDTPEPLSARFSYMLHPHFNFSLGAGVWTGYQRYTTYACPVCGMTEDSGEKTFILPNDLMLSLTYVF